MLRTRYKLLIAATAALALVALASLWWGLAGRQAGVIRAGSSGTALVGGPFSLTDHQGRRVSEADLKGHLTLIYFGFTYCPDICPTELQSIGAALDQAGGKDGEIQALFITIDPERDTIEALASYMQNFHPAMRGLTGSKDEIAAAAKAYRVYFSKVEDKPGSNTYLMDHSSIIYLMGRDGKFLKHFGLGTPPEEIAAKLREYR